jgi:hypothetical protein
MSSATPSVTAARRSSASSWRRVAAIAGVAGLMSLAPGASAMVFVDDLRLTGGTGVSPDSVREDFHSNGTSDGGPDGIYHYDDIHKSAGGEVTFGWYGGMLYRYGGGLVYGFGGEYIGATYQAPLSSNSTIVHLEEGGPFAQVGWGYAFDHWTHLEVTAFISGGAARGGWVDYDTPATIAHGHGSYIQGGVRVGFFWVLARHLELGVQGELSDMSSYIKVTNPNGSESDLTIDSSGGAIQGVIGVHF